MTSNQSQLGQPQSMAMQANNNGMSNNPKIQQLATRPMQEMAHSVKIYQNFMKQNKNMSRAQHSGYGQHQHPGHSHPAHHHQHHQQQHHMEPHPGMEQDQSDLDNTNLYIKGLWKDCTQVELDDLFKQFGVISQSRVYGDGVGFVRFEQGHSAKAAIDKMDGAKLDRCQDRLLVKYAFKKQRNSKRYIRVGDEVKQYEVEMIMNKNTNNVYLRCLPRKFTEAQLTELCEPFGELTCTRLRESGVAFVRYRKAEDAQSAIRSLNGKRFENHDETLLAKLANSDPFQPKIGFKQRPYDEEDISSVAESTNTMTPSQGNEMHAAQQHHAAQQQQAIHAQNTGPRHSQHQTKHSHHPQHVNPSGGAPTNTQFANNQYGAQHNQFGHGPHSQQSGNAYNAPQQGGGHHAPPSYNNAYDAPQQHAGYNHYGPPPNHPGPYSQHGHYANHYRPSNGPAPYPHNYTDPSSAYPGPEQPNYAAANPGAAPYGQPPPNAGGPPGNGQQQPVAAYPYYAYSPYPAYYPAQPTAYMVAAQPVTPSVQQPPATPTTAQQTASTQPSQPGTSNAVDVVTTPNNATSSNPSGNAPPSAPSTNPTAPSTVATGASPSKASSSSSSNAAVTAATKPVTSPTDISSASIKQPQALTPNISNLSAASGGIASGKPSTVPSAVSAVVVPNAQSANASLIYAQPFMPQLSGVGISMTSPPGSELSFRQHPASEISSIAGAVSDMIAHGGITVPTSSKVAGRPTIPVTPETSALPGSSAGASPYGNIGHLSPGHPRTTTHHQWTAAAFTPQTQPPTQPQGVGIEEAVKQLVIVPETNTMEEKANEIDEALSKDLNDDNKDGKKTSNPHHVNKETANKLHGVITEWYPKKAGKLTGMFLQGHDQEKVIKYLGRPEKLRKKIDQFVNLLSNQMTKPRQENE